jgi:hypothetical protein
MSKKNKQQAEARHAFSLSTNVGLVHFEFVQQGRAFVVQRMERDEAPDYQVGFQSSGPGVENLDTTSDAFNVFDISTKIRTADATLGVFEMRAFDIDSLRAALKKAKFASWNHEAI